VVISCQFYELGEKEEQVLQVSDMPTHDRGIIHNQDDAARSAYILSSDLSISRRRLSPLRRLSLTPQAPHKTVLRPCGKIAP